MFDVIEATVTQLQQAMEAGLISAHELVRHYLNRISAYDSDGPCIRSIITINSNAIQTAIELDMERKQNGPRSPLHGIPVVLKDCFDTMDMLSTGGTYALANCLPLADAFVVKKLREAGAILLAKANLHELVRGGTTISTLGGQTRNPYDLQRTPGGSSGGTAAAVAANLCAIGMGTDTVNSIRSPASATSTVGFKPTMGLVSRRGTIPGSLTFDMVGPITRTVADAAIMLDIIVGYDPCDQVTAWSCGNVPKTYTSYLKNDGLIGKRLGLITNFMGNDIENREVNKAIDSAVNELKRLGATIVEIYFDDLDSDSLVSELGVQVYETKVQLNNYLSNLGSSSPVSNLEELLAFGKLNPEVEKRLIAAQELENPLAETIYKEKLLKRRKLQQHIIKMMADFDLDAYIYPHQKQLVAKIGAKQIGRNGVLAAYSGFPAITVPAGFSSPTATAPIGVPIGIEFMGRPWGEGTLIEVAYSFEQATLYRRPPSATP
jgi:amidase